MDRTNRRRQILATRGERDQGAEPTHDILIAVVDGLKGFPEAITAVFPETVVQTCIVHPIRYSTQFASWNELKPIAAALKPIYRANNAGTTAHELEAFDQSLWVRKYPVIAQSWRRNWEAVIPFFKSPADVRKITYALKEVPLGDTTNATKSLNASVRKAIRDKGHFPNHQAATELIWLALRHITENWKNPPVTWHAARAQLAIQFGEPFTLTD